METAALPLASPFEDEIVAFEEADAIQPPPKGAVLFVGSSSFALWTSLACDLPDFTVINRGFGGSIIAHSTLHAPRIVWPYSPRVIVFYAGDNDLAQGLSPEQVLADFQEFANATHANLPGTSLAFVSIKPSPARVGLRKEATRANALVRDWIETKRTRPLRFIDVWTPMTNDRGRARAELFGPDKLHMNARGYAIWAQIIALNLHAILASDKSHTHNLQTPRPASDGVATAK